ncbi:MAG TPA: RluA family pseudouridine synthase [Saprospiraceae bacterium]|nr:RluA family pseudouridine synthase [Saprospiraceae bacterium]HNT20159.1 RluA family pseudouridine synthase [Saprospiraceae bacterium]
MSWYKLEILFEDEDLLAVNKPSGLLSIPDRWDQEKESLYYILGESRAGLMVVHRLDKDTSGVIVFAKNQEAHRILNDQFSKNENRKIYWAIVGQPVSEPGTIDTPIAADPFVAGKMTIHRKGKAALTYFKPLENFRDFTLLEVQIETGRTHQIRVHLSSIGLPLAFDPLYGSDRPITIRDIKKRNLREPEETASALMARVPLHALSITLKHPKNLQEMTITAPLPKDFKALLQQLRKWGR